MSKRGACPSAKLAHLDPVCRRWAFWWAKRFCTHYAFWWAFYTHYAFWWARVGLRSSPLCCVDLTPHFAPSYIRRSHRTESDPPTHPFPRPHPPPGGPGWKSRREISGRMTFYPEGSVHT